MPTLVTHILLGQITAADLKMRLERPGDDRHFKSRPGGLGKALQTPEARLAFDFSHNDCRVNNPEALFQLSLLFKNSRDHQPDSRDVHKNANKEAICLAILYMQLESAETSKLRQEARRRLEELDAQHFDGKLLPRVTLTTHFQALEQQAKKMIPELKMQILPSLSLYSDIPSEIIETPITNSIEEEKYASPPTLSQGVVDIVDIFPEPTTDDKTAPAALPPKSNSHSVVTEALSLLNTESVLPYNTETLAQCKQRQKDFLVGEMAKWKLHEVQRLLRLMIKVQDRGDKKGYFEILRLEGDPARRLFGDFGATTSWQELGLAVKKALVEKLDQVCREEKQPAIIKSKLDAVSYRYYREMLEARLGRVYQGCRDHVAIEDFEKKFEVARVVR